MSMPWHDDDPTGWREQGLWRERALSLIDGPACDSYAELQEANLEAVVCALLDVADAIRSLRHDPEKLRELINAAPTAEGLALLMRAVQTDEATSERNAQ